MHSLLNNTDSMNHSKEIETRTPISNDKLLLTQKKLESIGFELIEQFVQKDIILDKPDASLFKSGQKIRIREEKGNAELTYKGLFEGSQDFSRRTEINMQIDPKNINNLIKIFDSLGYPFLFQIIKNRSIYKKDGITATFDNWPIIGTLLEIEGDELEVSKVIKHFAGDFEFKNTRLKDLFLNKISETNKSLSELKELYENSTGNKLGKIELIID